MRHSAGQKGVRLLRANLTPAQLQQYEQHCYFDVIGGDTGHHYRIRYSKVMNIDQLDASGSRTNKWCFFPAGNLVVGDVMLAQKIALELFEREALSVANRFPSAHLPHWRASSAEWLSGDCWVGSRLSPALRSMRAGSGSRSLRSRHGITITSF